MADPTPTREEDLRQLLTDAIEVQLAALKAGISFWSEWIEQTSSFVDTATKTLAAIGSQDQNGKDTLLELFDASRASLRSITDIPRHTASRFIEELDKLEAEKKKASAAPARGARRGSGAPASPAGATAAAAAKPSAPRPRRGRVKA